MNLLWYVTNYSFFFPFLSSFVSHHNCTWYHRCGWNKLSLNILACVCAFICEGHGGAGKVSNDNNCLLPRCYGIHSYVWRHEWRILQQRPWLVSVSYSLPYVMRFQRHGFLSQSMKCIEMSIFRMPWYIIIGVIYNL